MARPRRADGPLLCIADVGQIHGRHVLNAHTSTGEQKDVQARQAEHLTTTDKGVSMQWADYAMLTTAQ